MNTLGLATWIAELKEANQLFEEKYLERTQEYGAATPETIAVKRIETNQVYYELRKFIEANATLNPIVEAYPVLINQINTLIAQYNTVLNKRLK